MKREFRVEPWHRNLGALWLAQTLSAVGFSFILPFIPLYVRALGVVGVTEAAQWAGMIGAASAVSMTIAQPIWGTLADRYGRRPMVIRSMVGGGIIITVMGFATSPGQLLALRFVQGAITGVSAASTALAATSVPKRRLGFALGLMQVAMFVGTSVGPLVGGVIADTLGYRASFYASGALLLLGGAIVIGLVREDFTPPAADEPRRSVWAESRALLAMGVLPVLVGIVFLIQLGGMIVSPVLSLFVEELSQGANAATAAGTIMAATGLASATAAVLIGRLSDRVGHGVVLPVCLLGAAAAYFPQAAVSELWQLLALRLILGLFLGGLMPSANALVASIVPEARRGAAFGLTATANALAHLVGPLAGAGIATQWGMREVFVATGVLFAAAWAWVSLTLRRAGLAQPRPRPRPPAQQGPRVAA